MKKMYSIRLNQEIIDKLKIISKNNCRSSSEQIEYWVKNGASLHDKK